MLFIPFFSPFWLCFTDDEDRFSDEVNMLFRVVHIAPFNTSLQVRIIMKKSVITSLRKV